MHDNLRQQIIKKTHKLINTYTVLILFLFFILYVGVFSHLTVNRFLSFGAHYYDLGIMDQTVYNTSQGYFLDMTNPHLLKNTSRLAIHFDPILAIFAPFYSLYADPKVLLIVQTVLLAAGGLALYVIALHITGSKLISLFISLLYFLYYPMQNSNLFDFHAVTIATTSLFFMYLFLKIKPFQKQWMNMFLGIIFLTISLLCKEHISLTTLFFGLYLWVTEKKKSIPLFIITLSMTTFIIVVFKVIPYFKEGLPNAIEYYDFRNPFVLFKRLFDWESYNYIYNLLLPVGFISLLSPLHLLIATPDILINLLSSNGNMRAFYFHYTATITPFVFIAATYGIKKLYSFLEKKLYKRELIAILLLILLTAIYTNWKKGALVRADYTIDAKRLDMVRYWQKRLNDDRITVSATGKIAPFFTARRYFIDFLYDPSYMSTGKTKEDLHDEIGKYERADYVLIYTNEIDTSSTISMTYYNHLKTNPNYQMVDDREGIEVYERRDIINLNK